MKSVLTEVTQTLCRGYGYNDPNLDDFNDLLTGEDPNVIHKVIIGLQRNSHHFRYAVEVPLFWLRVFVNYGRIETNFYETIRLYIAQQMKLKYEIQS